MIPSNEYLIRKYEAWFSADRAVTILEACSLTGLTHPQIISLTKAPPENNGWRRVEPISMAPQLNLEGTENIRGRPSNLYSLHDIVIEAFHRGLLRGVRKKGRSYDGK